MTPGPFVFCKHPNCMRLPIPGGIYCIEHDYEHPKEEPELKFGGNRKYRRRMAAMVRQGKVLIVPNK